MILVADDEPVVLDVVCTALEMAGMRVLRASNGAEAVRVHGAHRGQLDLALLDMMMPELNGRLDGYAIRVPTINVSIVDLSFIAARDTTADEVNAVMKAASEAGPLKGILNYNKAPLVSIDFNHDPASSTFDATLTKVSGRLVKVSSWYDNEWGFSNRMLDTTVALMGAK